ncbi:MAG: hypothetical protein QOE70_4325 [Chthoniobacter sp.]|nr:hypothetical protein [Chthoniobacter sp.]
MRDEKLRAEFARKLAHRKADIERLIADGVPGVDDKLIGVLCRLALLEIELWEQQRDGLRANPHN